MAISLTILLGILTYVSLWITFILGILTKRGKPVFRYHRFFAILTMVLATSHMLVVVYFVYFS